MCLALALAFGVAVSGHLALVHPRPKLELPSLFRVMELVQVFRERSETFDEDGVVGVVLALAAACHQAGEVASARVVARCDKSKGIRTR